MRVIGGELRSRRLKSMPGMDVRPTPDRLRETLFDVLATRILDKVFVDAYAGTGAVGIEALSRGARRAIFVEKHRDTVNLIRENLRALGIANRAEVVWGKAAVKLPKVEGDIVFLDPPYTREEEYDAALAAMAEAPPPLVIAQHSSRFALKAEYGKLRRYRTLRQGDNTLSFFAPAEAPC
jgi:16S rRNA (guanine(966)-N(2))-methyltransferase RsmD